MKLVHTGYRLLLAAWLLPAVSDAQGITNNTKAKELTMSTTQNNKEIVRRMYEEAMNKRNLDLLKTVISEDVTGAPGKKGVAVIEEPIRSLIKAFPDIQWQLEDLFGEGDKVVVRWKWKGTQVAPFGNFPSTGQTVTNGGMAIYQLKNGKIIDIQIETDRLGFLQGLGVVPANPATLLQPKAHPGGVNFIDKFFIPAAGKKEFYDRMQINRVFIRKLPGFIEDHAYEYTDPDGNLICITIARWESTEAIAKAKDAVQAEYKREGFNPEEMFKRLNIVMDRGIYTEGQ